MPEGYECRSRRNSSRSCVAAPDHPRREGHIPGDRCSHGGRSRLTMSRSCHPALAPKPPAAARCRIAGLLLMLVCLDAVSPVIAQSILQSRAGQEPITPIPVIPAEDPQRLALGERLFNDRRLSRDNIRSCATCHDVGTNGATANARDAATDGRPLALNTLTVFNASLSFRLNWEGKYRRLEDEARQVLQNPEIMASSADAAVAKLRADPEIVKQFRDA